MRLRLYGILVLNCKFNNNDSPIYIGDNIAAKQLTNWNGDGLGGGMTIVLINSSSLTLYINKTSLVPTEPVGEEAYVYTRTERLLTQ